jgi:hypothetical protein
MNFQVFERHFGEGTCNIKLSYVVDKNNKLLLRCHDLLAKCILCCAYQAACTFCKKLEASSMRNVFHMIQRPSTSSVASLYSKVVFNKFHRCVKLLIRVSSSWQLALSRKLIPRRVHAVSHGKMRSSPLRGEAFRPVDLNSERLSLPIRVLSLQTPSISLVTLIVLLTKTNIRLLALKTDLARLALGHAARVEQASPHENPL